MYQVREFEAGKAKSNFLEKQNFSTDLKRRNARQKEKEHMPRPKKKKKNIERQKTGRMVLERLARSRFW